MKDAELERKSWTTKVAKSYNWIEVLKSMDGFSRRPENAIGIPRRLARP